ncbi:hypothetical protein DY000_02040847 [Brassica cretica]|uniref:Uncharacterized protein n=1 Tax=Brassica cretica TaxID=69181 RepID=A0ABQ7BHD1_BRACR|nr:hypothetical protein DY000_02040847 [Brassica cretica]
MVDLSICCSEHDVSRCFSEHGGTLLMSWGSWPEPASRVVDVLQCAWNFIWLIVIAVTSLSSACRRRRSSRHGTLPWRLWNCELWSRTSLTPFFRVSLVQAGYLIKGRFPFILRQDKSLGLEVGGWRQGPRPRGRDPDPGVGTRNLEAGTWKPEAGNRKHSRCVVPALPGQSDFWGHMASGHFDSDDDNDED